MIREWLPNEYVVPFFLSLVLEITSQLKNSTNWSLVHLHHTYSFLPVEHKWMIMRHIYNWKIVSLKWKLNYFTFGNYIVLSFGMLSETCPKCTKRIFRSISATKFEIVYIISLEPSLFISSLSWFVGHQERLPLLATI